MLNEWLLIILIFQHPHKMTSIQLHYPTWAQCSQVGKTLSKDLTIIQNKDSYWTEAAIQTTTYSCHKINKGKAFKNK